MTTAPTRRERKRRAVRDQLYEAALALFVSQGFDATTMDEIAEHADVGRTTVFHHYGQKAAFLEEWGRRRRARVAKILAAGQTTDLPAAERIRRYLSELAKLNITNRADTVALMDAAVRFGTPLRGPALEIELADVVRRGQETGEFRNEVDPVLVGQLLAAGYFATVMRWTGDEPAPFDLVARLDDLVTLVLASLLPGGSV